MRINKFLAECGVASRRAADQMLQEGRVYLNGKKAQTGMDINPETDAVFVDGQRVNLISQHIYLMLNKPKGCVSTTKDEHGRKTVLDLLPKRYEGKRIFPVGRLDYDTEGLLILTTDGDLSNRLTHPKHEIPKTYVAKIVGEITQDSLKYLANGVEIDGQKTKKCSVKLLDFVDGKSRIQVIISEGKNRQVRKMFDHIGREVVFLKRTAIGDLTLSGMSRGEVRQLGEREINYLKNL